MSENKYKTVISIDCMGGDLGEQEVLKGIIKAYKENNSLFFIIHGAGKKLPKLLYKQKSLLKEEIILLKTKNFLSLVLINLCLRLFTFKQFLIRQYLF